MTGLFKVVSLVFSIIFVFTAFSGQVSAGSDGSISSTGVVLSVNAPERASAGALFSVWIDINEIEDLDAASYQLNYDADVLELDEVNPGNINGTEIPVFGNPVSVGCYRVVQNLEGLEGVSGAGYLTEYIFQAVGETGDSSYIYLSDRVISTVLAEEIIPVTSSALVEIGLIRGDADEDGNLDAVDVTTVERMIAGLTAENSLADANDDGDIDSLDITTIERLIVGLEGEIPVDPGDPVYGGTLRIICPYSPSSVPGWPGDTTNPYKLWACWICFEGLVKLDTAGNPTPWLATDWTWGPDNAYIDFNLRQGVKFHDGTDFTAESVVTHVNQLFTDKNSATGNWDRIEKTGDYAFRLYLKVYMRDFWNNLAAWSMVISSDTQLKEKGLDYVKEHPIGTGPFLYSSYEKDVNLKFVRNDNYWQSGKPYLDAIEFYKVPEPMTQQAVMEAGDGDVLVLRTGKVLQDLDNAGFSVVTRTDSTDFIMFDTANEGAVTNDPTVRLAIEYALNKQEIADALGYGGMQPNNQIPFPGNPAFNPDLPTREYNPDKARELLAQAGYPHGFEMKMFVVDSTIDQSILIQSYLAAVGIDLHLVVISNSQWWGYLFNGWEGIMSVGYAMGTNLPNFIRSYFPPESVMNVSVKIPDDILELINAAMVETDDAQFQAMSNQVSQWIFDEAFFVPTVGVAMGYVFRPEVKDHEMLTNYVDFSVWSPEKCWLDQD